MEKQKKCNIVIYNYREFNEKIGGIERVSVSLTKGLISNGYNVFLVAILKSKYKIPYSTPVPIKFLPSEDTKSQENIDAFHKILVDNSIDVLIDQDTHSLASHELCYNAIKGTKTKLISVLHFCPSTRLLLYKYPWDDNIFRLRENILRLLKHIGYKFPFNLYTLRDLQKHFKKVYEDSDSVVLLSQKFIPEYVQTGRLKEFEKLCAINNMLSFPLKSYDTKKEKRLLFCARMEIQKRPERALYVWSKLQDRLTDWTFDFVGDGSLIPRLKTLSEKLRLKNIEFHGFKDPKAFYEKSSIYILTSDYEGWPLTITEAMQNRCVPVVMNTFASASETIDDGINGYLIPDCKCSVMADRVYELATNKRLLIDMSQAAYKKMERFTPENIVANWIELINKKATE